MRFKLRLSAAKKGLKLRFGRCKRNTQISSTAAHRSFTAPISAPPAFTIELLSAPSRQQKRPPSCATD